MLVEARARLISLLKARENREDRYAALLSRCQTSVAHRLTFDLHSMLADWEMKTGKRVRRRLSRRGVVYVDAIERFVGDLLCARADNNASGRIYRSLGKSAFEDASVNYDVFMGVLDGLKALELVGHEKGQTRYRKTGFWPGHSVTLPGRASRFWATAKLIDFVEPYGIRVDNISDHFKPEPPNNPLVLRDYGRGKGVNRERGPIIKNYERTEHTKQLAADVRELNEFLEGCEITGGEHHGYTRNFNNASWNKGGRLYSIGGGYQQLSEEKRLQMTINGEPVAEIDIKASYLTIYHARLRVPLEKHVDPYERAGVERSIAKIWMVESFGKSKPETRWPPETIKNYKKETGKDLREVTKAKDVAQKMLSAFPALHKLEDHSDIWADLQFIEAEAVINTMLILKRTHSIPSLSMHDGLILPRSKAELAKTVLAKEYRKFVGVEPMLTVEMADIDTDL